MITSEITFEVDGLRCAGTLYRPDGWAGARPSVVMGHGITLTRRDGIPAASRNLDRVVGAADAFADHRHAQDHVAGGEHRDPEPQDRSELDRDHDQ